MRLRGILFACLLVIMTGCASGTQSASAPRVSPTATPPLANPGVFGPRELRLAYGVDSLIKQGVTGKGVTIMDLVCFGSPTLQSDLDAYSAAYGLPHVAVQVVEPVGPNPTPTTDAERNFQAGWAGETTLDVELYHALAPDAGIVVLAVPVCKAEGITGLPESRETLQYAFDHHLGQIVAISGGTSEKTLQDPASRAELQKWDALLQQSTTQQGITYLVSSGDNGATDYIDTDATQLATSQTTSFPTDSPWVTSVGGTTLTFSGGATQEIAWNSPSGGASGGGFSAFYTEPDYQKALPGADQSLANGRRGVPDVAADADPATGVRIYVGGRWIPGVRATSIAAPISAGIIAIADQAAGKPLGFLNPALYNIGASPAAAQDFHDITSGNNTVSVGPTVVPGFTTAKGWDPVTGWGTPDAERLIPDLIKDAND